MGRVAEGMEDRWGRCTLWHDPLKSLCAEVCRAAGSHVPADTVLFYVARWCQKKTGVTEPDIAAFDYGDLADIAANVVRNLENDDDRVERLAAGDANAWTELHRLLYASVYSKFGTKFGASAACYYADEARQKIAWVLLTGTPPSQAAAQLATAFEDPRNEYIFTSPFPFWACRVVINLIIDDKRRAARRARAASRVPPPQKPAGLDDATCKLAFEALPSLLEAISELPPRQRSVMVWTLMRRDLDPLAIECLRNLAPDLFAGIPYGVVNSDHDIAARLGKTAHQVAANRSVARVDLAARNPYWKLLLDVLMPHKGKSPSQKEDHDG